MPRKARERSKTGIYHIMLRGANRQEIFHEDEDYQRFLKILRKYIYNSGAKVYGWCLMSNHIHLLIGEGREDLSLTMKRIGVSFVWYYNWKYDTIGHLFQDRFQSEKVENDAYLLVVLRYIHQNPVKAGLVRRVEDWKWSSYNGYYENNPFPEGLLDSDQILSMFSAKKISHDNKELLRARFRKFNEQEFDDQCMDDELKLRINDEEARKMITQQIDGIVLTQVKSLPKAERDEIFRKVKGIIGVSQRQAARIFGVSANLIFKA